jgi:hypothetical protein
MIKLPLLPLMFLFPAIPCAIVLWGSSQSTKGIQPRDIVAALLSAMFVVGLELFAYFRAKKHLQNIQR